MRPLPFKDVLSIYNLQAGHTHFAVPVHPTGVPPLIQVREAKAASTAAHFAKTEAASAKAGSTTVVTYEDDSSGYPQAPTKYSFRELLDSLSADDYQRRVNEDPQFAAAIDKLSNGNR